MAFEKSVSVFIQIILVVCFALNLGNAQVLKLDYYQKTCPSAETIVKLATASFMSRAPTLAAPILRMHFHDCFVRGCDGSVLLNSTKNNLSEKEGPGNKGLRGFQVIDSIKTELESICPGVVSCADILALVARDAVSMLKGSVPYWDVPLGRRDGRVSIMQESITNLPPPFADISLLKSSFASKGLNTKDLVVLSGAHTIGTSHCSSFTTRIYNFSGKGDADPALDPNYVVNLKSKCKPTDLDTLVEMDPGSFKTFDKYYYTFVQKRRVLFQSDSALLDDKETSDYVKLQASNGYTFLKDFGVSMEKMGKIGVLTGNAGEIRRKCALVN